MATVGRGRKNPPGYLGTVYKPRELTGSEKTLFDIQMSGYSKSYQEKFPEVTRQQYSESVKRSIIAPQYQSEKLYTERMISMLDAGSDPRAASRAAATAVNAAIVKKQIDQQTRMKAVAKASKSNFGAAAMTAGMTGAGTLAGSSTVGGAASAGTSLIKPDIQKAVTTPKISVADQAMKQAAEERSETAKAKIESEVKVQQQLAPIRQRRRRAVERQASLLNRRTGRRALMSSPAGGAGFFGGYFKG